MLRMKKRTNKTVESRSSSTATGTSWLARTPTPRGCPTATKCGKGENQLPYQHEMQRNLRRSWIEPQRRSMMRRSLLVNCCGFRPKPGPTWPLQSAGSALQRRGHQSGRLLKRGINIGTEIPDFSEMQAGGLNGCELRTWRRIESWVCGGYDWGK